MVIDKQFIKNIIVVNDFQVLIHRYYQQGKPSRPHVQDRHVTLLKYVLLIETVYKVVLAPDILVSTDVL